MSGSQPVHAVLCQPRPPPPQKKLYVRNSDIGKLTHSHTLSRPQPRTLLAYKKKIWKEKRKRFHSFSFSFFLSFSSWSFLPSSYLFLLAQCIFQLSGHCSNVNSVQHSKTCSVRKYTIDQIKCRALSMSKQQKYDVKTLLWKSDSLDPNQSCSSFYFGEKKQPFFINQHWWFF